MKIRSASVALLGAVLMLSACNRKGDYGAAHKLVNVAPIQTKIVDEAPRRLAYEHWLTLDVAEQALTEQFESAKAACRSNDADPCELLESRLDTGHTRNASLKLRTTPKGVQKLVAQLQTQGELVEQSTTAEDLTAPLTDNEKKLAMLLDYRSKLQTLRVSASRDVDALIKVHHELAQVQADLEAAQAEQARLDKRVQLEILHLTLQSQRHRAFWRPVHDAASDFGKNLSEGLATTVVALAFLLPWLAIFGVLFWFGRKLRARRLANRKAPPPN